MKPLRESRDGEDSLAASAARLLRAAQPVEDPTAKARVRLALARPPAAPAYGSWGLAVAALVVAGMAGLGVAELVRARRVATPIASSPLPMAPTAPRTLDAPPLAPPVATPLVPPVRLPARVKRPRVAPAQPARPRAADVPPTMDPRENALVVEAMTRLRHDHDPVAAGALLHQYLQRFPDGALGEEATALAIESALAAHDTAEAGRLAARYLRRFPDGRFHDLAESAAELAP